MEVYRQGGLVGDLPDRIPLGIPERHHVIRVGDLETAHAAALDHAPHLFYSSLNRGVRDAGETRVAIGVGVAEVGEPFIVDPHQFDGGLGVIQPPGGAEDPVEHLRLHAVALLILQAQLRVGEPPDAALAVLVETGRSHAVGALDFARDVFAPRRPHAVHEPEVRALLRHPYRSLGAVGDVRHAVLHRRRGARREEVGRQPAEIDVAVGRDSGVAHIGPPNAVVQSVKQTTARFRAKRKPQS